MKKSNKAIIAILILIIIGCLAYLVTNIVPMIDLGTENKEAKRELTHNEQIYFNELKTNIDNVVYNMDKEKPTVLLDLSFEATTTSVIDNWDDEMFTSISSDVLVDDDFTIATEPSFSETMLPPISEIEPNFENIQTIENPYTSIQPETNSFEESVKQTEMSQSLEIIPPSDVVVIPSEIPVAVTDD